MPEIDGIQGIIRFKQEFPELRIIAMTGACSDGRCDYIFNLARTNGAIDIYNKDEDMNRLLSKVKMVL